MKLLILKGDAPRHDHFAAELSRIEGVEALVLAPRRLGGTRLRRMLLKQPKTFFARVGKYIAYRFVRWNDRERAFFGTGVHGRDVENLNDVEVLTLAREFAPDMIAAFGVPIISDDLIDVPKWGAVNLHGGISPQYKGGNTIFWPLVQGKAEMAGATLHYMVSKVDSGRILVKVYPALEESDDECSASCKTFKSATEEFVKLVEWARDHKSLPEGEPQCGESHLYRAVDRGLFTSIVGSRAIRRRMKGVRLPLRVERKYV